MFFCPNCVGQLFRVVDCRCTPLKLRISKPLTLSVKIPIGIQKKCLVNCFPDITLFVILHRALAYRFLLNWLGNLATVASETIRFSSRVHIKLRMTKMSHPTTDFSRFCEKLDSLKEALFQELGDYYSTVNANIRWCYEFCDSGDLEFAYTPRKQPIPLRITGTSL